ncbi:MAG TPA: glycoside hydrolase family 172 protein [Clostridia bacterium]|nr:glycoside hydrolase family 172 protein [Clostridia bacterium]
MKLISRLLAYWVVCSSVLAQAAGERIGIEELYRLDRLPAFKESVKLGAISSYDRTGGNDDGFSGKYSFIRQDPEGLVIADLKGPGVIYRLWTPTPTDDVMEFVFDGESKPRIEVKFRELFLGQHPVFPRPLVGFGAGGYYCYLPIPFAKSCVVRVRGPKVQFYQINYALYSPGTTIETFTPEASSAYLQHRQKACEVFQAAGSDISRFTAPPNAKLEVSRSAIALKPKSTKTVFQSRKGGRIVGLRFSPTEAIAGKARDLLLKISFDGEEPAVLCPLGDFFGYAWGQPATRSLLVGTVGTTNYCYLPMPYDRSAVVELVSERDAPVELQAEVVHAAVPRTANEGKFYAMWRRENPTKIGEPFTFLETSGRGHLVGVVLQSQGFESGKTLFFEGDDETTIDGELVIRGTGSEDFFNGGWYDVPERWEKRISFPLSGCLGYAKHLGRTGAYRFFLGDAYSYRQSLRQTIEHAGEKNSILTDYCGVTYFYSERRPTCQLTLPPLKDRAVQDPQEIIFPAWWQTPIYAWSFDRATLSRKKEQIDKEEVRWLSLAATGEDWFGPHFISFTCDLPAAGNYSIYIEAVKGEAQAQVQLFQNENPVADAVDLYAEKPVKSGRLLMGKLELAEGKNNLMFKLVGKNEKSTGLGLDLIQVICVREQ